MRITTAALLRAFPRDLDEFKAKLIADYVRKAGSHKSVDEALEVADRMLEAHGIEAIRGAEFRNGYYGDIVGLYVNMGDTYNTTVLYDTVADRFHITSWGDWVEKYDRKYKIQ